VWECGSVGVWECGSVGVYGTEVIRRSNSLGYSYVMWTSAHSVYSMHVSSVSVTSIKNVW
jgi:hypothetical protein